MATLKRRRGVIGWKCRQVTRAHSLAGTHLAAWPWLGVASQGHSCRPLSAGGSLACPQIQRRTLALYFLYSAPNFRFR